MTMNDRRDERKELGSPRTTTTSTSYDVDSLDTLPPMHERLGRIILSSSSSDDTPATSYCSSDSSSSGSSKKACNCGSPTKSQRDRSIRRLVNPNRSQQQQHVSKSSPLPSSSPESDETDDLSGAVPELLRALNQLNKLAILDSAEYQNRLLENSLPALQLQTEAKNSLYFPSLSSDNTHTNAQTVPGSRQLLAQPIQIPLVRLSMSIHRLHALIANVTQEIDGHTDEVRERQSQLDVLGRRNRKLETVAKTIHEKNLKLKKQSRHDRKVAKGLQRKVQEYEARLESQRFQLMASKVQQHELQLQLQSQLITSQKHNDSGSSINSGISNDKEKRERLDSSTSTSDFFDIAEESEGVAIVTVRSDLSEIITEINRKENRECKVDGSPTIRTTATTRSRYQQNSNSVFDNTPPTLRFSAEGSVTSSSSRSIDSSSNSSSCKNSTCTDKASTSDWNSNSTSSSPCPDSTDSCCNEKPIGGVVVGIDTPTPTKTQSKSRLSLSNRFAKFLGQRSVSYYNLKMVLPCNLQFVELLLHQVDKQPSGWQEHKKENRQQQSQMACSSSSRTATNVVKDHGIVHNPNNCSSATLTRSLDSNSSNHSFWHSQQKRTAFAVCGFEGFNTETNMKPTLGARLTKINGQTIDEMWTLEKIYSELAGSSSCVSNENKKSSENKRNGVKPIVLTFRDETWDKVQYEDLIKAIRIQQRDVGKVAVGVAAAPSTDTEEHHGRFSNIKSGGNEIITDESDDRGAMNEHYFERARTASTESFGKAVNGFGNFFQNFGPLVEGSSGC